MQGLQQYIAFSATAQHGGFAAAAREQGVTPSTLAKAVARLESELGVKLFHRTTRQVRLTPDGERLYERCRRVLAEVADLHADALGSRAAPSGLLRINMPVYYGKRFVMPLLVELLRKFPALQLDLRFSDKFADLVLENLDLAVRIGALGDSSLVARKVDQQHLVLCASPRYLAARGTPRRLEDLAGHDAITFRLPTSGRQRPWQFRQRGATVELMPSPRIFINDTESLVDALKTDTGLCQLPDNLVENELRRGELIEVLASCRPEPLPINLVYQSGRLLPARVRAAIEALDALRQRAAQKR
jgi:LysR family transcriptional regulator for bpeEF and oprC